MAKKYRKLKPDLLPYQYNGKVEIDLEAVGEDANPSFDYAEIILSSVTIKYCVRINGDVICNNNFS